MDIGSHAMPRALLGKACRPLVNVLLIAASEKTNRQTHFVRV